MANTINTLDPAFMSLINNQISMERQPITRLTTQRDSIQVQKGVYTDLRDQLDGLMTATKALRSSDPFFALTPARKFSVAGAPSGSTVVSGTVSTSAIAASYSLGNITLAKAHRVRSDAFSSANQALALAGSFYIGGEAAARIASQTALAGTVDGLSSSAVTAGQTELGSGSYHIETRQSSGAWQFRLVDAEGKAMAIKKADDGTFTDGWLAIPTGGGSYDTGRGLSIQFGADAGAYAAKDRLNGAALVSYVAKGALVEVKASDSLMDIATNINKAAYADGNSVIATVVDRRLVLSSARTGAASTIVASDLPTPDGEGNPVPQILHSLGILAGAAFKNTLSTGSDAQFTLNGVPVTRSQNTGLTDVIEGVTLNLAADAEGKTATINIEADNGQMTKAVNDFVSKFNALQTFLGVKLAVTKQSDGTYKRGPLTGDSMISSLRLDMFRLFTTSTAGSGTLKNLRDIGLDLDSDMKAKVIDSTKLEKALLSDYDNVKGLLNQVMGGIESKLGQYTGSSAYVTTAIQSSDRQVTDINSRITTLNQRLTARQEALTNQYAQIQAQLVLLQYQQQQLSASMSSLSYLG